MRAIAIGIFMVVLGVLSIGVLVELWPAVEAASAAEPPPEIRVTLFALAFSVSSGAVFLLLVIVMGVLGSVIHGARSLANFLGWGQFDAKWSWWYLLRPIVGPGLAILAYFALLGGLLGSNADTADLNPYGIAAIAGLTGLFSKKAIEKLEEVFEVIFKAETIPPQRSTQQTVLPDVTRE